MKLSTDSKAYQLSGLLAVVTLIHATVPIFAALTVIGLMALAAYLRYLDSDLRSGI